MKQAAVKKQTNKGGVLDQLRKVARKIAKVAVDKNITGDQALTELWPDVMALGTSVLKYLIRRGMSEAVQVCMMTYETSEGPKQFGDLDLDDQKFIKGLMRARGRLGIGPSKRS